MNIVIVLVIKVYWTADWKTFMKSYVVLEEESVLKLSEQTTQSSGVECTSARVPSAARGPFSGWREAGFTRESSLAEHT